VEIGQEEFFASGIFAGLEPGVPSFLGVAWRGSFLAPVTDDPLGFPPLVVDIDLHRVGAATSVPSEKYWHVLAEGNNRYSRRAAVGFTAGDARSLDVLLFTRVDVGILL